MINMRRRQALCDLGVETDKLTGKERPILFTPHNAQKVFDGTKTQTRRIMNPQPQGQVVPEMLAACPYGIVGDRLWIREAFCLCGNEGSKQLLYRGQFEAYTAPRPIWKPSIHMPRWACRTVVELTEIHVERLQDTSEEDAMAEGVIPYDDRQWNPIEAFQYLWESINGKGSWALNPWVWVLTFKNIEVVER